MERLPGIERAAGEAFRSLGMDAIADDEPIPADVLDGYRQAGRTWVAVDGGDRPVGHLVLDAVDGAGHVEQVIVDPGARGRRLGAALLDAAQAMLGLSARPRAAMRRTGPSVPIPSP